MWLNGFQLTKVGLRIHHRTESYDVVIGCYCLLLENCPSEVGHLMQPSDSNLQDVFREDQENLNKEIGLASYASPV